MARFGEEAWQKIRQAAGIEEEVFLSNESYPDAMTYRLVGAASQVLGLSANDVLEAFGDHWVSKTAQEGYGSMMDVCGRTLPDFLRNLDNLHTRVNLIFPKLRPPGFTVSDETPTSLVLHYESHREGLTSFVVGLLKGLGRKFKTPVTVTLIAPRAPGSQKESFLVEWAASETAVPAA